MKRHMGNLKLPAETAGTVINLFTGKVRNSSVSRLPIKPNFRWCTRVLLAVGLVIRETSGTPVKRNRREIEEKRKRNRREIEEKWKGRIESSAIKG